MTTSFYSPEGAVLTKDPITVEVPVIEDQYADFYYKHFGETFGHQPPEPDKLMPWRHQLSEINQQLAPSITLASRQASASRDPIVESRAATTETQDNEITCKIMFYLFENLQSIVYLSSIPVLSQVL